MDTANEEYALKGPDANAKVVFTHEGFLVKAGSIARRETVSSDKSVAPCWISNLVAQGSIRLAKILELCLVDQ